MLRFLLCVPPPPDLLWVPPLPDWMNYANVHSLAYSLTHFPVNCLLIMYSITIYSFSITFHSFLFFSLHRWNNSFSKISKMYQLMIRCKRCYLTVAKPLYKSVENGPFLKCNGQKKSCTWKNLVTKSRGLNFISLAKQTHISK